MRINAYLKTMGTPVIENSISQSLSVASQTQRKQGTILTGSSGGRSNSTRDAYNVSISEKGRSLSESEFKQDQQEEEVRFLRDQQRDEANFKQEQVREETVFKRKQQQKLAEFKRKNMLKEKYQYA